MRLPQPDADTMLRLLEEIKACSQEIDNLLIGLALRRETNQAVLAEAVAVTAELNRRVIRAADEAEAIRRGDSARVRAAREREARRKLE